MSLGEFFVTWFPWLCLYYAPTFVAAALGYSRWFEVWIWNTFPGIGFLWATWFVWDWIGNGRPGSDF